MSAGNATPKPGANGAHAPGEEDLELPQLVQTLVAEIRDEIRSAMSEAVRRAVAPAPGAPDRIVARQGDRFVFVRPEEIDAVESARNYVSLHAGRNTYLLRWTLLDAERWLDPACFLRIHRCVIVNVKRIADVSIGAHSEYDITMQNGRAFTSGRVYRQQLRRFLNNQCAPPGGEPVAE